MSRTSFRVNPHSIICLDVKERLARSRRHIWSLSDSNRIRTHNQLVRKWTLNNLRKTTQPLNKHKPIRLNGWVFVYELGGCGFQSRSFHLKSFYATLIQPDFCLAFRGLHLYNLKSLSTIQFYTTLEQLDSH